MPAHLALRASCPPYGEGMTYYALRELVAGAGLGLDDVQAFTVAVTEQVGDPDGRTVAQTLGRAFGMVEGVSTPEDIGWATRRLLQGLAQWGPVVVVVVDDVQWAEPALVELLLAVADRQAGPVLLVCLARPELLEQHPDWPGALRLGALAGGEVAALAATLLGGGLEPGLERFLGARAHSGRFVCRRRSRRHRHARHERRNANSAMIQSTGSIPATSFVEQSLEDLEGLSTSAFSVAAGLFPRDPVLR